MHAISQYLWHWLIAVNDHSLQAPFIYDFYSKVLTKRDFNEDYLAIEDARDQLIKSNTMIEVSSFGARSKVSNKRKRPVAKIARWGITSAQTSMLLNRIIKTYELNSILELGTSFGINTMYLALDRNRSVLTFEGCRNTLEIAKQNFDNLDYNNISIIDGDIDTTLPATLSQMTGSVDFAFIDANHQLKPTIEYFELLYSRSNNNSVFVFDDIHWSSEMSKAWKTISKDERVTLSIDLYNIGILFFRPELQKQHYRIRY